MALQGYHCAREAITASEGNHLRAILESRQVRITAWLDRVTADFRFLESSPCVRGTCGMSVGENAVEQGGSCSDVCNLLDDLKLSAPFYDLLAAYDTDWNPLVWSAGLGCCDSGITSGTTIDEVNGDPAGVAAIIDFAPAAELKEKLRAASLPVFTQSINAPRNRLILQVGLTCRKMTSSATAYLAASLNASRTVDPILLDSSGLGHLGRAYLITPDGLYPSSKNSERSIREWEEFLPTLEFSQRPSTVRSYIGGNGEPVLGAAISIPDMNWVLIVEVAQSEAFAWLVVLRNRAVITGLVTLLLVILLSGRSALKLAKPFKELAAVAGRIASGAKDERVGELNGAEANEVAGAFNHMLDELESSQRQLIQAASLAAIGELSASVVHEIRNPLSSIKMNIQALGKKVAGDAPHAELAAIAFEQVSRVEKMLNELLSFGKPIELMPQTVALDQIFVSVRDVVGPMAESKDVKLEIAGECKDLTVSVDLEQFSRALTNLMINAVQASPCGGRISLFVETEVSPSRYLRFRVRDTGDGIPAVHATHIFQPFFTTRDNGTGLGLAIAKKIVECHGGTITAANVATGGAEFMLRLPYGVLSR